MHDEGAFLDAIRSDPHEPLSRLAYADWLEERGDARGAFLRLHLALRSLSPDHPHRVSGEHQLSLLRRGLDASWLAAAEPERAHLAGDAAEVPPCRCVDASRPKRRRPEVAFHAEPQDTECDAWKRLLDLVEQAAADGREVFAPGRHLAPGDWVRVVTLPPTIARLKAVRHLLLYGSHLVRLPPEVGQMSGLEDFDPYTSYRLHWFPYEITRCTNLRRSTVSTRALYGNYKYRPPFPRLRPEAVPAGLPPGQGEATAVRDCSVCGRPFEDRRRHRVWVSLRVATDVLPLLVNACSEECIGRLPRGADGHVQEPHRGGPEVRQPPAAY
jgi:uncharacterized protein (TIGR02996 family)